MPSEQGHVYCEDHNAEPPSKKGRCLQSDVDKCHTSRIRQLIKIEIAEKM